MMILQRIMTAILTAFLFVLPVFAQETKPLEGQIEHSANLAPLPDGLKQGGKFDEQSLPTLTPKNNWSPIPKWMAGTWQFKSETVTHMRPINNKKKYPKVPFVLRNEFQKIHGYQIDKSGQVWDYVKAPYSYTCKVDNGLVAYNRCIIVDNIVQDADSYVRRVAGDDSVVEPNSQQILLTLSKECINRYTTMGDDAIRIDASTKIFDREGNPTLLKISNMMGVRVKPFDPVDEKDGENLRELFADFLKASGKADLVP
jgi:hypothetical protein